MRLTTPVAYFLTFVTYGSRVPGEPNAVSRRANGYAEPRTPLRRGLANKSRELMPYPQVILDQPMRLVAELAIRQHCEFRGWDLHALNVRTNHAHLVVTTEDTSAAHALMQIKARATRLLREREMSPAGVPVWARHGSTRILWKEDDLVEVVDYVLFRQGSPLT